MLRGYVSLSDPSDRQRDTGKGELIDLMLDAAFGQPPDPDDDAAGWRARLERWAREECAVYYRHRWTLQVAVGSSAVGPNRLEWLEGALRAISGIGLTEKEMLFVALLLAGYDRGATQISLDVTEAERYTGIRAERCGRSSPGSWGGSWMATATRRWRAS